MGDHLVAVRFEPSGRALEVQRGTTLFDAAVSAGLLVGSSCGQEGVCARCGLRILEGAQGLTEETASETKVKDDNGVETAWRLSCLARLDADGVVATADYW